MVMKCRKIRTLNSYMQMFNILNFFLQFINHLINHLARHQLLKIACQLEKKNMLRAYSLLKVIESELQAYLSATKSRVVSWILWYGLCIVVWIHVFLQMFSLWCPKGHYYIYYQLPFYTFLSVCDTFHVNISSLNFRVWIDISIC